MNMASGVTLKIISERFEYHYDLPHPLEGIFVVKGDMDFDTNTVHFDSVEIEGKCVMDSFDLDWLATEYIMKEYV